MLERAPVFSLLPAPFFFLFFLWSQIIVEILCVDTYEGFRLGFQRIYSYEAKTQVSPQKGLRTVYERPWPENTDSSYPKFMFQRAYRDLKSYSDRTKKVTTKKLLITLLRTSGTGHSKARQSLLRHFDCRRFLVCWVNTFQKVSPASHKDIRSATKVDKEWLVTE